MDKTGTKHLQKPSQTPACQAPQHTGCCSSWMSWMHPHCPHPCRAGGAAQGAKEGGGRSLWPGLQPQPLRSQTGHGALTQGVLPCPEEKGQHTPGLSPAPQEDTLLVMSAGLILLI